MPQRPFVTQRLVFSADGSSDAFYWGGGRGVLSAQGNQGGGTLSAMAYLRTESGESGDAEGGTYAIVTDEITGNAASISGLTAETGLSSVEFHLPPCYVKMTLAGSTSPAFVGVISRDIVRTQ